MKGERVLMPQQTKKVLGVLVIFTACTFLPGALCADTSHKVLATVGSETITQADMDARTAMLPPQIRSRYETSAGRQQLLEQVVLISLLSQEARRQGIDKQDEVAKRIKEMTDNIIVQELTRQQVSAEVAVSDEDIAAYYQANKNEFVRPEQINASVIVFSAAPAAAPAEKALKQKQAQETLKRLKKGADFAAVAREVSDDKRTQARGGATGFFAEGRREKIYGKKFEEVAFALKAGDMSDVFETEFGYFIVRLDDRQPRTEESLSEAKSKIGRRLQQTKQREAYEKYVEGLKAKYPVKYSQ
jgi:peptidyl-prolyl cis-trans isomerase C